MSRRTLFRNSGLAAAALAGLSSCTTYGGTQSSSSAAPAAGGGATGGAGLTAKTSEIPIGSGKIFADAATVITQPTKGEFKAFTAICTHQQCTVHDVTTTINCTCHGSKFSIEDGSVVQGPATAPLPEKKVTVKGGEITLA